MTPLQTHETPAQGELQLHRAQSQRDEAAFIAAQVRAWIDEGTPPQRIAVLFRSVRTIDAYAAALVDRDVPIVVGGDANVFADRRALDALALLWNVYDPFRHEWMLRTLENPGLGLSDSTLALLCAEPPSPQAPLFIHDDEPAPTVRSSRWDPKRDLRLGWNVVRGEQDAALAPIARERIERFRKLREGWIEALYVLPFEAFVRRVWSEGLASEGEAGSARERIQQTVLQMLMRRMLAYMEGRPDATIADVLEYAQHRSQSDLETCTPPPDCNDCVSVLSIEAAQGLQFDRIVVAGVRAGSFPLWYVPDSFLFSPRLGMVPKENAGDARAARTAKFSYYMFRTKAREGYNAQERRAFVYALRRGRRSVLVTSWGNPTKGVTAPEFFEELRTAGIAGTDIV
jgi:superfamily I DNA/RNA helicase